MSDSTLWWLITAVAVAVELVTGTFYLLMLALGMAAGAVAAHLGLEVPGQLVTAAVFGGGAVAFWYHKRRQDPAQLPARANRDVNLDIGTLLQIDEWASDGTAQVKHRGAMWTAALMPGVTHVGSGSYRIEQVVGNRLLVVPA